jgi:release factor glutamine methyltransferase
LSTVQQTLRRGTKLFGKSSRPALEAKLLLLRATGLSEEDFLKAPGRSLSRAEERCFNRLAAVRLIGCPLAYLTGFKEFWSRDFRVTPGVLIPRPETELIVEKVCALSSRAKVTIVDVGTGCGNIALSLAKELPRAQIVATDISRRSLKIARLNAGNHHLRRLTFLNGDLLLPLRKLRLQGRCDFIVSNPPYVSQRDWMKLPLEIREHEPKRALLAGPTGLEAVSRLVQQAPHYLKRGGWLLIEIGKGQLQRVIGLFGSVWEGVAWAADLRGIPRVVMARKA